MTPLYRRLFSFVFVLIFLFAAGGKKLLFAENYYLLPEVVATSSNPQLGMFITSLRRENSSSAYYDSNTGTPEDVLLSIPLDFPIQNPAVIFAGTIRGKMSAFLPDNFVLVGNYCAYIPKTFRDENKDSVDTWLQLLKKVAAKVENRNGWVEVVPGDGKDKMDPAETITTRAYTAALENKGKKRPGELVTDADLRKVYILKEEGKQYLQMLPGDAEYTAARTLAAGTVLRENDIKKREIVRSGERVTIVVKRHPIYMKLEGIAYGSGGKGDTVRVRPIRSNRSLYGKVMPNREVYIEGL